MASDTPIGPRYRGNMGHQRRFLTVLICFLLLALGSAACGSSSPTAGEILLVSPAEARQVLADRSPEVVVLDVRTPEEFSQGRLAGAVNLDFYGDDFVDQLDGLPRDRPYVVYCRSGNRSKLTIDLMRDQGFSQVWEVDGGIISWAEAGLPVEN